MILKIEKTIGGRYGKFGPENAMISYSVTAKKDTGETIASFSLREGEPEDMIFGRNLEGPESIKEMIQAAYQAGQEAQNLVLDEKEIK